MNVNQIEIALSQKISASSTNFDLLAAAKALQLLRTNGIFIASTSSSLPAAASNEGKIYFIEDIETVVWSNGTDWLRLLDKTKFQAQLWSWGCNSTLAPGRLGDGTTVDKCSPVREFCSATDWCRVSAGDLTTSAIKLSGQIWSWGRGVSGMLGDGTVADKCSPVREYCSASNWCQLSAYRHTLAIKTSGELWAWGYATSGGRLGDGTQTSKCSPVREFCSATDWCQASAGRLHSAAVKTSGQLWTWGRNSLNQLGDGTAADKCSPVREICSATDWCQVSAGDTHSSAVKTTGEIWSWGYNYFGALGDGTTVSKCSPVRERCSATDWCGVSAGPAWGLAIKTTGQIWSWGQGYGGVRGSGTTTRSLSPVREFCSATNWCLVDTGKNSSAAIKTSGELWVWGCNNLGQIGDGTTVSRCSPVREFYSATNWCSVSAGGCAAAGLRLI